MCTKIDWKVCVYTASGILNMLFCLAILANVTYHVLQEPPTATPEIIVRDLSLSTLSIMSSTLLLSWNTMLGNLKSNIIFWLGLHAFVIIFHSITVAYFTLNQDIWLSLYGGPAIPAVYFWRKAFCLFKSIMGFNQSKDADERSQVYSCLKKLLPPNIRTILKVADETKKISQIVKEENSHEISNLPPSQKETQKCNAVEMTKIRPKSEYDNVPLLQQKYENRNIHNAEEFV